MAGGSADEGASVLETPPLVLALVFSFFLVVTLGTDWVSLVAWRQGKGFSSSCVWFNCIAFRRGEGRVERLNSHRPPITNHRPPTTHPP